MPEIIVTTDKQADGGQPVMFRERVSAQDFDSPHFARQLVERIGWAVGDAAVFQTRSADPIDSEPEYGTDESERGTDFDSISSLPVSPALGRAW
jgi:hypothetical protein